MMCQKTFFPSAIIENLYLKLGKQILEVRKIAPPYDHQAAAASAIQIAPLHKLTEMLLQGQFC